MSIRATTLFRHLGAAVGCALLLLATTTVRGYVLSDLSGCQPFGIYADPSAHSFLLDSDGSGLNVYVSASDGGSATEYYNCSMMILPQTGDTTRVAPVDVQWDVDYSSVNSDTGSPRGAADILFQDGTYRFYEVVEAAPATSVSQTVTLNTNTRYLFEIDAQVNAAGSVGVLAENMGHTHLTLPEETVSSGPVISTFAGTGGVAGYGGDGGPATSATLRFPQAVAVDSQGNVFIADGSNHVVRKVDTGGVITTFAGTGTSGDSGDGGPAASATLADPIGLAVGPDDALYISDDSASVVRKVDAAGTISTVAGTPFSRGHSGDGGPGTSATLSFPTGVAVDAGGNVYIAERGAGFIRKVDPFGTITSVVSGIGAYYIALDGNGNMYVSDYSNNVIRKVDGAGTISTILGGFPTGYSGDRGPAADAQINGPFGVATDADGNLFIADENNHAVRRIDAATGIITTVAGNGAPGYSGDGGPAADAQLHFPADVRVANGSLYIADLINYVVRRVDGLGSASITVLSSSLNPSVAGQDVTFAATLPGSPLTGVVTFMDGPDTLCANVILNGNSASCTTAALSVGTHSIAATYSGDEAHAPSTSNLLSQRVLRPYPTTFAWTGATSALWSDPNNWNPVDVPQSGDALVFPAGASNQANSNDLPAGTTFTMLAFTGGSYTIGGNGIVLTNSLTGGGDAVLNLLIDVQGNSIAMDLPGGVVTLAGQLSGTGPINLSGQTAILSAGGSYSGTITLACCSTNLLLNGMYLPYARVVGNGAILNYSGNGALGSLSSSRILAPEDSTGSSYLSIGDLDLSGSVGVRINGAEPGWSYDQFHTTGSVALAGTLDIAIGPAFIPSLYQQFVLIDNAGASPVNGAFDGLPEGSVLTLGGYRFFLSYQGGDGNDVVLTCILSPMAWTGASSDLWSDPNNWNQLRAPQSGDALVFPAGAMHETNTNDLPAGTAFTTLAFDGDSYTIGGNGITLMNSLTGGGSALINLPIDVQGNPVSVDLPGGVIVIAGGLSGVGPIDISGQTGILSATGTYSGTITLACCSTNLFLSGMSLPSATVVGNGAILNYSGDGILGALSSSRILAPADRSKTGTLSVGDLDLGGTVTLDINGAGPGSGYDQIKASGNIALGGTLDVALGAAFVPSLNEQFVLIDNSSANPVNGTFSGLPEGSVMTLSGYQLLLSYQGGDGNDVTLTTLPGTQPSTTALTSSLNPSAPGQSVTFTATVSGQAPTGFVTFRNGASVLCANVPLGAGTAACATAALPAGPNPVTATYSGDATNAGSTSNTVTQNVISANPSSTTLTSSLNPSNYGQAVTFTAKVTGQSPTGSMTFNDGPTPICSAVALASGKATCRTTTLAAGTHAIAAVYSGDANNAASTSPTVAQVVNVVTTTTALISSLNPSTFGRTVTFTATVAGQSPTGTVTFSDGASALCADVAVTTNKARCVTSTLAVGAHTIGAVYSGDGNNTGSSSAAVVQVVNVAPTTTTLGSTPNPSKFGQVVTFTARVNGQTPSGTVTFTDGSDTLCAAVPLASGVAKCATSTLAVGSHSITAAYTGDTNNAPSASTALTQTVNVATSHTALSSTPRPSKFGQAVTFTATVTGQSPSGTVTFYDGATSICVDVVLNNAIASCVTAALIVGSHSITAAYSGDADNGPSTSAVLTQTVNPAVTATTLVSSINPSSVGQAVVFTATVTGQSPTGTITFNDGTTPLCTAVSMSAGSATCTTSALSAGTHSVKATYSGDGNNATSTSVALKQSVK